MTSSGPNGTGWSALAGLGLKPPPRKPVEYRAYAIKSGVAWKDSSTMGFQRVAWTSTGTLKSPTLV